MATMSDPRQILPREVPVARWTAAVVTSNASDLVSSLVVSLKAPEGDSLPVEIPLANDSGDCYFPNSPDNTPSPEPSERDERNEPSSIGTNVEYPSVVATGRQLIQAKGGGSLRVTPVSYHTKPDHHGEEREGSECKDGQ